MNLKEYSRVWCISQIYLNILTPTEHYKQHRIKLLSDINTFVKIIWLASHLIRCVNSILMHSQKQHWRPPSPTLQLKWESSTGSSEEMRIGRKEGWFQGIKNRFRQGFQLVPQPDEGEEIDHCPLLPDAQCLNCSIICFVFVFVLLFLFYSCFKQEDKLGPYYFNLTGSASQILLILPRNSAFIHFKILTFV